jgi:hypothetical protein
MGQELAVMDLDGQGSAIVLHEDKKYYPEVRALSGWLVGVVDTIGASIASLMIACAFH